MTVVIKNIFDAIADSPEDAADLKLRSSLIDLVKAELVNQALAGKAAQSRLGLDNEAFANFKQGAISEFTPGQLAHMLKLLGRDVEVSIAQAA